MSHDIILSGEPMSSSSVELSQNMPFTHSWLEGDIQRHLVDQISQKVHLACADEFSRSNVFVVTSTQYFNGSINTPFDIVTERPRGVTGFALVGGPFDAHFASAFAYLEQERVILSSATPSEEAKKALHKGGITSINARGQGVARLAGQLSAWRTHNPDWSNEKLIEHVVVETYDRLTKEHEEYRLRYEEKARDFGYKKDATAYATWQEAEERLRGFQQGVLLLGELLQHPWA